MAHPISIRPHPCNDLHNVKINPSTIGEVGIALPSTREESLQERTILLRIGYYLHGIGGVVVCALGNRSWLKDAHLEKPIVLQQKKKKRDKST